MKYLVFISLFLVFSGCTKKDAATTSSSDGAAAASSSEEQLVARGQTIYKMNCIACHNPDPAVEGPTGPSIKGSSLELVQLRVLKAQYPEGYKPKRDTKVMPPLPHLEKEVPAIHAFLNAK
ncbi:MAG: cytochrome [Bacteroidetes bacterium]|nr:cytochrome [Bacteroidota bacterium]